MKAKPTPLRGLASLSSSVAFLLGVAACIGPAAATSFTWTGEYDQNWGDVRNWSPHGVPGDGDSVTIGGSVDAGGRSLSLASLNLVSGSTWNLVNVVAGNFTASGGAIWLQSLEVTGTCNWSGGTVHATSCLLSCPAASWTGGTANCQMNVPAATTLQISSGEPTLGTDTVLVNHGQVVMNGGQLRGWDRSVVENRGTWTLGGPGTPFTNYYGNNTFTNHGLLVKSGGTEPCHLSQAWTYQLGGETRCLDGELRFVSTVNLPAGALLSGAGTIRSTGVTNLQGPVVSTVAALVLDGGTLAAAAGSSVTGELAWAGGWISGTCTVPTGSILRVTGSGDRRMATNAVIDNRGWLVFEASTPVMGWENATIRNHPGGEFRCTADGDLFANYYGGNHFINDGLFHKISGAGEALWNDWKVTLNGTTRVDAGSLACEGETHLAGGSAFEGSGSLRLAGDIRLEGPVTESIATLTMTGGSLACSGPASLAGVMVWEAGTVSGTLGVAAGSELVVSGSGFKRLAGGAEVNVAGIWRWLGPGGVEAWENCRLNILQGGLCDLAADGDPFNNHYGNNALHNLGTLRKSAGAGELSCNDWTLHHGGTLEVMQGVFRIDGVAHLAGGAAITGAGGAWFDGDVRLDGPVMESIQSLRFTAGGLACTAPCSIQGRFDWEAGTLSGGLAVPHGSIIEVHGEGFKRLATGTRVDVSGTWRWSGPAGVEGYEHVRVNILAGGVCDLAADGDPFHNFYGDNELVNEGRLLKSAGGGGSTLCNDWTYRMRGRASCSVSSLEFASHLVLEGSSVVDGAGQVLVYGQISLPGAVQFMAPSVWTGGNWIGQGGTISGVLQWTGGISHGTWTIGPAGTLEVLHGSGVLKRVSAPAEIHVAGLLRVGSGSVNGYDAGSFIRVLAGGRLQVAGTAAFDEFYDGPRIEVRAGGLLDATAAADLGCWWALDNHGIVAVPAGRLTLHGGGASSGSFVSGEAGRLAFAAGTQSLSAGADVSGPGPVEVTGGLLEALDPVSCRVQVAGGTVRGSAPVGRFEFKDGSRWTTGFIEGSLRVPVDATLEVAGTEGLRRANTNASVIINGRLLWSGDGPIECYENTSWTVSAGGSLELAGNGAVFSKYYEGHVLANHGVIRRTVSTGDVTLAVVSSDHDGSFDIRTGRLIVTSPQVLRHGVRVGGGGRLVLAGGTTTLVGTTTVSGATLEIAGANVASGGLDDGRLAGSMIEWSGGWISGVVTFDGVARTTGSGFRGIGTLSELRNAGVLTLAGGGVIQNYEQSTLRNLPGATLEATGQVSLTQYYGGNLLVNGGTMTIGSSPGRMVVGHGFVQEASGRLEVGVAGSNPGLPEFDILEVQGWATIAGTLVVVAEQGYDPPPGTALEILSSYYRIGMFQQVQSARFTATYPVVGDPPFSLNNVVLVANSGGGIEYDTWAEQHHLTGADALESADKDRDGTPNLVEFALHMNPEQADAQPTAGGFETIGGERWLVLRYRRWSDRQDAGVSYQGEWSSALDASWATLGVIDEFDALAAPVAGSDPRICRVRADLARKFLRLSFGLAP